MQTHDSSILPSQSMPSRRAFLRGAVIAASTPSVVLAPERNINSAARLTIADGHAEPFASKGDVVVFDEAIRKLESGAVYVTVTETSGKPFVGRAWADTDGCWWVERFARKDVYGPITPQMLQARIQGRVQAVWKNIA